MFIPTDTITFQYIVLPLIIIISRVLDVTIGTIRIIYVSKGLKHLAPILGFFEVFIWITVVGEVINGNNSLFTSVCYALGFALGTYVGMLIEGKISMGYVIVRLITKQEPEQLIKTFQEQKIRFNNVASEDDSGKSSVVLVVAKRKKLPLILNYIRHFNPKAFFTIEDLRLVSDPYEEIQSWKSPFALFFNRRKERIHKLLYSGFRKGK